MKERGGREWSGRRVIVIIIDDRRDCGEGRGEPSLLRASSIMLSTMGAIAGRAVCDAAFFEYLLCFSVIIVDCKFSLPSVMPTAAPTPGENLSENPSVNPFKNLNENPSKNLSKNPSENTSENPCEARGHAVSVVGVIAGRAEGGTVVFRMRCHHHHHH